MVCCGESVTLRPPSHFIIATDTNKGIMKNTWERPTGVEAGADRNTEEGRTDDIRDTKTYTDPVELSFTIKTSLFLSSCE